MQKNTTPCYYGDYLQLEKILTAQAPESAKYAAEAHDETLFIIVHQTYELWFKQILHELKAVMSVFAEAEVKDEQLTGIVHKLKRIITIQKLLNSQIAVIETMTPQDFMSFRDYLVPASGFQSVQFKMLEIGLGLKSDYRIDFDKNSFYSRLNDKDRDFLQQLEHEPSLFERIEKWLERMPFLQLDNFSFWQMYGQATETMLADDKKTVQGIEQIAEHEREMQLKEIERTAEKFSALLDADKYQQLQKDGAFRLSQKAMLSALFINLYQEEPMFNLPFQLLTCLTEIDENLTIWRYKHAMMVQRMLGTKIGTGGSSGHDYLKRTTEKNRIFTDLFNMATFLLPKSDLPALPKDIKRHLGFYFAGQA
ncbi:tryptophan 2,3-dioxygenase family protein [Rheinheimera sp. MMS21-TC3]|uniref:tryptophan 2,3-dioxygenase family protein n=1 Tax=Rheinheimera sp. MMS21-TC3 TaxID=3072790 RepID=UPI0028C3DF66|nr:tryptophan 2,3-dioxygenase family protein [Rheinheimera sp. MMS21-TC3]WNO61977.1 tryptophan 2,3-dioxygenase family protein [Rheinheimera sp. MMS21-TC3]